MPSYEFAASQATFDQEYEILRPPDSEDCNVYAAGKIRDHNVIMACLPAGNPGVGSAPIAATYMRWSFKSTCFGVMVGIGGGVTTRANDIRLGDVMVRRPA